MKTTLVVPDVQIPFHDTLMLSKLIKVASELRPDAILQIGDLIDFPQVSRWSKGTAGEYAPTLQGHIERTKKEFLQPMREAAPSAKFTWIAGNHDERIKDFVNQYAYPLRFLEALSMESLFDLDAYGVQYVRGPERVATNTYAIHGHESSGYCSTISAWDTKFAGRYGSDKNYIFGHTHQPALVTRAYGFDGKVTPRWTLNAGSVMDPVHATYIKDGSVSWTMSFAVLHDDGKRTYPQLITADNRQFIYNGKKY